MRSLLYCVPAVILTTLMLIPQVYASGQSNSLTLINHSGESALVKVVGPSRHSVEVPNGSERTVTIAGGMYRIYVRYGKGPEYRYSKGDPFEIKDSPSTYTKASLTLHPVPNGNYHTEDSSENEFNQH